jgi:GNAT superfamily N-acetyltransferase
MNLSFADTTFADIDTLVHIRIAAMRESLERVGRFDPVRARERFVASFDPAFCRFILIDGAQAGFVLFRSLADHLVLDHLYIVPAQQGRGIGQAVLADSKSLPIKVGALRDSDSNRFYRRHGFVKTGESEWDIYYVREPRGRIS